MDKHRARKVAREDTSEEEYGPGGKLQIDGDLIPDNRPITGHKAHSDTPPRIITLTFLTPNTPSHVTPHHRPICTSPKRESYL